ncbi:large conductance mechanosensitive channel protein MscL [Aquisediminimonas sediminicola]|uniref:large conductance mechanosensitive channel protein MscL n=1 Tax=Alteraquisediminimonas sediminicola TaxID=2676787 RepID=UPI001C8D41DF|nr:large conductance mechanosensitive channel protein MscL [Aquisediminimonas sediminicola]
MALFSEFKAFINRGNVLDLAVGVIIGAAFGKIVSSLTDNLIMPVISAIIGGIDFSNLYIVLGHAPDGANDLAALKAAGVPVLAYGSFIGEAINFMILAFVVFMIVRTASKLIKPAEVAPAGDPADVLLLREILGELKKRD